MAASSDLQFGLFDTSEVPDTFRKAVQVIHSMPRTPLSLVQRKIGNAWLKHALENDPDSNGWWSMGVTHLAHEIGFDSNNNKHLKTAAEALMSIVYQWDVLAPVTKQTIWKASVLFPEVELHADVIRYQFSSQMRERLLNPDVFAIIDMNVVRKLRRSASIALWEHCVRYEGIGRTGEIPWELLRNIMLGEDSAKTYLQYKFFKSKVLNPALKEINQESEHVITMLENRVGRRISVLQFTVKRKHEAPNPPSAESIELITAMCALNIPGSEARKLARLHSLEAIRGALNYTKERQEDKKLRPLASPGAYFRNALEKQYSKAAAKAAPESSAPKTDLRAMYLKSRLPETESYFHELDIAEQTLLIEAYNAQQPTESLRMGEKRTKKSTLLLFFNWLLIHTWGEPTAEELVAFAQATISASQ